QAAKFSLLVLYPSFLLLAVAHGARRFVVSRRSCEPDVSVPRPGLTQLLALLALSLLVLNLTYRFDEFGKPLGTFEFKSQFLSGDASADPYEANTGNRFRGTLLSALPVPLPGQYVLGFDAQKHDEECGFMWLRGGRLVHRGAWYNPMQTLLFKLPLGTLILVFACAGYWVCASRSFGAAAATPFVSALFLIGMLCTQTGLNWPVRYSLPAIPLLIVACGGAIRAFWKSVPGRALVVACLLWNVAALLGSRPYYFSYANELAGGSGAGRQYFMGSNYDWGQDLFRLKPWCEASPDRQPVAVCYYGELSPESLQVRTMGLPESFLSVQEEDPPPTAAQEQKPFYWAVSWNFLAGLSMDVTLANGLRDRAMVDPTRLSPDLACARIGYTMFVFHILPDHAPFARGSLTYGQLRSCLRRVTGRERSYNTP
ncbi:MAG: hypothetical protein ACP5XB_18550, partial [Isosphaeraceae bacterium]